MTTAWTAERFVSAADVAQWLHAVGYIPQNPIQQIAEGFDNYIFEVDDMYVRTARRHQAAPDLCKEVRLLQLLASTLPFRVPEPTIIPPDIEQMEWPWFAFKPVPGQDCVDALLDGRDLNKIAADLGAALRQLHDPLYLEHTRGWMREDIFRRTDMPYRIQKCRRSLEELAQQNVLLPFDALNAALDEAKHLGILPNIALVHGDLHLRHVMHDTHDRMTGLIDWGDTHIGHPACDFYAYWSLFSPGERQTFLSHYGPADEATLAAGRVVAIYINAVLALSAEDFGLPLLRLAALEALRRTTVTQL